MENNFTIIVGNINSKSGKNYYAEIINDTLVVKRETILKNEETNELLQKTICFIPNSRGGPFFYLVLDTMINHHYSYTSFHIILLYRHYHDVIEKRFEIISKGFTNSINRPYKQLTDPLLKMKRCLNKEFLKSKSIINNVEYEISFKNIVFKKDNNLCPADFTSCMYLIPFDNTFIDKLYDIYLFAIRFLQFITLNTYPIVDQLIIRNSVGGYSEINIFNDYSEDDNKNDRFLYLRPLHRDINKLTDCFPNIMKGQHNLFHYKKGWVFEFDIVRLSGSFEGVFRDNVEKAPTYKRLLDKRKEEIHYKELSQELKAFSEKHHIKNNDDFTSCRHMFDIYGGTLKNKLEFVLDEFCKTMNYIIVETDFFYSPAKFESRIKDSRNMVCHGLRNRKIDWSSIGNDTLLLQELIYYILLKFKLQLSNAVIRSILEESFGVFNHNIYFFKKDDSRIKWK